MEEQNEMKIRMLEEDGEKVKQGIGGEERRSERKNRGRVGRGRSKGRL